MKKNEEESIEISNKLVILTNVVNILIHNSVFPGKAKRIVSKANAAPDTQQTVWLCLQRLLNSRS